ncbi:MAG TPA: hypothetical protein VHO03_05900 [Ignavibacteriales bacterium]|nr:hypothetical protein [Ignavibacteriales bacterium]
MAGKRIAYKVSALYFGDKPVGGWTAAEKVRASGMTFEENYNELDTTDNGQTDDSVEITMGIASRQSKIDGTLRDAGGLPIMGKSSSFVLDGKAIAATGLSFEETYDEEEVSDEDTVGDGTETDVTYAKRTSKISAWFKDTVARPVAAVAKAATLTIKTGFTIAGQFIVGATSIAGQSKGFFKIDLTGNWNNCVKTIPGFPVTGCVKDCKILYKDGAQDKAVEGKAIITQVSLSADRKSEWKFSFTLKWNGTPVETEYAEV